MDGITQLYSCIVLDFEFGEFIELFDGSPGFEHVIAAITDRLPGIDSQWFHRVQQLETDDLPIEVWRRD